MITPGISRALNVDRGRRRQILAASSFSHNNRVDSMEQLDLGGSGLYRVGRRIQTQRRWSLTTSTRHRRHHKRQHNPPVMWNIQGMRGKMPPNCLWHACQALVIGVVLFSAGGVMSYLGFESDGVFTNNGTAMAEGGRAYFYEDARGANVKFSKLSYAGPIVMGVGGFIIVAACVMTFEARDSAAKVGPAAFVPTEEVSMPFPIITKPRVPKPHADYRTVGTQTSEHLSSEAIHNLHIFDKRHLIETFRRFSRTVRQSSSKEDSSDMQRCPSAPNLFDEEEGGDSPKAHSPKPAVLAARRSSCLPKFKSRVPLVRQTMSIDYSSSSPFLPNNPRPSILGQFASRHHHLQRTSTTTSVASISEVGGTSEAGPSSQSSSSSDSKPSTDASGGSCATVKEAPVAAGISTRCSMPADLNTGTVDLHLPNGVVTLNVIHTSGSGGSSKTLGLRSLSPRPSLSFHSSEDSASHSFDLGSVKSDNFLMTKTPMMGMGHVKYRSESVGGRPTLIRQPKVDQAEIICIPDSDEEQQMQDDIPEIPEEAEHESDTD